MRYAKRNLRIVGIGTAIFLAAAVISLSSHAKSLRPVIQAEEQNGSALEAVLGNDILPNTAYDWGSVYTLNDGTDIAQKYVNEESGFTVYGGAEGYQVLGSDTGGGLVQGMGNILLSSVAKANRLARTGDSIVTTLHSSAMAAANEALAEYGNDVQAGICVVLRDGAVLVDAGNNVLSSPADVYLGISEQTDSFVNYNASAMAKGSVFKAIIGVDYSNEEFGKNQVRKVELMHDEDQVGVSIVSSYPAGYSLEEMETALKKLESEHLKVKLLSNIDPVYFPKDTYLVKSLEKAYETIMDEDGSAVTTTGGTYAKVVKNIVPFGPSFKGQKGIGHLPNEWMRICDIEKNTQIYAYALYELMQGL